MPLVYELDADLKPLKSYYLGDHGAVKESDGSGSSQGRQRNDGCSWINHSLLLYLEVWKIFLNVFSPLLPTPSSAFRHRVTCHLLSDFGNPSVAAIANLSIRRFSIVVKTFHELAFAINLQILDSVSFVADMSTLYLSPENDPIDRLRNIDARIFKPAFGFARFKLLSFSIIPRVELPLPSQNPKGCSLLTTKDNPSEISPTIPFQDKLE